MKPKITVLMTLAGFLLGLGLVASLAPARRFHSTAKPRLPRPSTTADVKNAAAATTAKWSVNRSLVLKRRTV